MAKSVAFMHEKHVITEDITHSQEASRYYYLWFWEHPNFRCRLLAKRQKLMSKQIKYSNKAIGPFKLVKERC